MNVLNTALCRIATVALAEHLLSTGVRVLGADTLDPGRIPHASSTGPLELTRHVPRNRP